MKWPVALFAVFVLVTALAGTWFFVSNRKAEAEYMRWEAQEIDRRVVIAQEIAAGDRDASESGWYDPATMGADVSEAALRTALRNQLRSNRNWFSPYRIPAQTE